ncbi:raffinose/stachyose/melibiose transport system permease protein [Caldicoprobacter guelmensis]|uniref:carbohydrate ABC transporter permease n=1 Tax=Caldicoprobacter guelmensis TaxID=1170224 RepID=UPI0019585015|nr:sugar ABC transporter permease [Caldicoprobacter guelmensis]MBM7583430.1 raffinose/stachyose/melibiose transport system permease protein [Caldicoprobacter guelmensis]
MDVIKNKKLAIIMFLLPGLTLYVLLVLYPIVNGIVLSMYRWKTVSIKVFAGLDNYLGVFTDSLFWKSVKNSLIFMIGTGLIQLPLGFILGYLLYLQLKGYRFFRTVYFIPPMLMSVAVGYIWGYIYSPAFGLLKPLMESIGLGKYYLPPLANSGTALFFIILAQAWHSTGIQMMLFNAGFMNMPEEVIEMSVIDGAVGWKKIFYIILPLSWEVTTSVIILQLTGALRSFDLIYVMTGGGPNHATEVLPIYMFVKAFQEFNIGYGAVAAIVIFILSISLTVGLQKLMKKETF